MSPRPAIEPGEHGVIRVREVTAWSVVPPPKPFAATTQWRDPNTLALRALRKFGDTPEEAEAALLELVEQRRRESAPSPFRTLGEAVAAFYAGSGPDRWSEATATTMAKARAHLDEVGEEPWPVSDERAAALWGDGTRMDELALRLLKAVRRG
ncbi:hypothetical protein [Microbacterium sp. Leaf203]|uniref:hypothetical protein n=1 Tax=Microbacterium sp. Leaf203 TaxID=1735677 RepID=UPI000ACA5590|nr:hypothetical protein [Microbacterium sp. Leaf203]